MSWWTPSEGWNLGCAFAMVDISRGLGQGKVLRPKEPLATVLQVMASGAGSTQNWHNQKTLVWGNPL